jgi:glycosyltransferase involved in cell wall biosynthesis
MTLSLRIPSIPGLTPEVDLSSHLLGQFIGKHWQLGRGGGDKDTAAASPAMSVSPIWDLRVSLELANKDSRFPVDVSMKNQKSVVHISTSDKIGGAAIAAWRLHGEMQGTGVDSRVVCRYASSVAPEVSSVTTALFGVLDMLNENFVPPAQAEKATFCPVSPVSLFLLDHPWIAAADVIHLHWVAQFLAPEDIVELCEAGKTVFWTLYDPWPYAAGCHCIGGLTCNEVEQDGRAQIGQSFREFARLEFQREKQLLVNQPIHVIAPSRWMAEEAVASGVFRREQIHVIPHGINTSVFRPARFQPHFPLDSQNQVSLLFGCPWLGDPPKGYNEFRQALVLCMLDAEFAAAVAAGLICVQTFGGIPEIGIDLPVPVIHLGTLEGELKVAEALRAASAFVCPTLEDNLPNVVMESLACGCPVVAFATGGVTDMVIHGQNGLLAPKGSVEALSRHLIDFCLDTRLRLRLRDNTRQTNLEDCSLETQATRVLDLYESVSSRRTGPNLRTMPNCVPTFQINATILPHYGTEIVKMLLEVKDRLESQCAKQSEESHTKITHAGSQLALSKEHLFKTQQQLLEVRKQQTQSDGKYELLRLQLLHAHDEIHAYFLDNRNLTKISQRSKILVQLERRKSKQIKRHLSYRLGTTIVTKSRSFRGWLHMPFSLIREIYRHRRRSINQHTRGDDVLEYSNIPKITSCPNTMVSSNIAVERIKQQLSYRIGNAFVRNSRSPLGWIKLPFAIAIEIIAFEKKRKIVSKKAGVNLSK